MQPSTVKDEVKHWKRIRLSLCWIGIERISSGFSLLLQLLYQEMCCTFEHISLMRTFSVTYPTSQQDLIVPFVTQKSKSEHRTNIQLTKTQLLYRHQQKYKHDNNLRPNSNWRRLRRHSLRQTVCLPRQKSSLHRTSPSRRHLRQCGVRPQKGHVGCRLHCRHGATRYETLRIYGRRGR